jgi:hypothetical protein
MGVARTFGTFDKISGGVGAFMEDHMRYANDEERLVAEQAVLNFRELRGVMKTAPHGKGMAVLEQAVREKGFEQMRQTLTLLAGAHAEAQKKGSIANAVPAVAGPTSKVARPKPC